MSFNIQSVLDYWKLEEILNQPTIEIIKESIKAGIDNDKYIKPLDKFYEIINKSEYKKEHDKCAYYYLGKISKEECIKKFASFLGSEIVDYPDAIDGSYAFCSFIVNIEYDEISKYPKCSIKKNSFTLSPVIWVLYCFAKHKLLDYEDYQNTNKEFYELHIDENESFNKYVYQEIYEIIIEEFIKTIFNGTVYSQDVNGFLIHAYSNNKKSLDELSKKFSSQLYSFSKSYFLDDLVLFSEYVKKNKFSYEAHKYNKAVLNYITEPFYNNFVNNRFNIAAKKNEESKLLNFFNEKLSIYETPLGKFPSKFPLVLMQQLAVNLACSDDNPIFSVNGPPGTGKTTLLKDIIANNIVKKAKLLYEYEPGKNCNLFTKKSDNFFYSIIDERINSYSILVASCNNGAVENITKELPEWERPKKKESDSKPDIEKLSEIEKLKTEVEKMFSPLTQDCELKDVYFSDLLNNDDPKKENLRWGLISVALGKKENISKVSKEILIPFLDRYGNEDSIREHYRKYKSAKEDFNSQYWNVINLQKQKKNKSSISKSFIENYMNEDKEVQIQSFLDDSYNCEREKLFYYSLQLTKEFILASPQFFDNLKGLLFYWRQIEGQFNWKKPTNEFTSLLQNLFLLIPVISTTFASTASFLKYVTEPNKLGLLIVDEAGQAQPQMALGTLFRCSKAVIVGDPKQVEPVVTEELSYLQQLLQNPDITPYFDKKNSVQKFADNINKYGTEIDGEWVGCPLVVHRRCIEPMFTISNNLSYDGIMKGEASQPKKDELFLFSTSKWFDISGLEKGNKNHYVKEQGEKVLDLLKQYFSKICNTTEKKPSLFIISPFKSVVKELSKLLEKEVLWNKADKWNDWIKENIGTVHTFQGKEAKEVIFVLGCSNDSKGAAEWVNKQKNIINVAATRAKYRFYVIGDSILWKNYKNVWFMHDCICYYTQNSEIEEKTDVYSEGDICPRCKNGILKIRTNKKNGIKFLGCSNFSFKFAKNSCNFTYSLKNEEV